MPEDEHASAMPDATDKASEVTKKHRKLRPPGAKTEAGSEITGEDTGATDVSSEEESGVSEHSAAHDERAAPAEPPVAREKAAKGGEKARKATPETPAEPGGSKAKSLVEMLRFDRRAGKRRR
jgi:hypothetical protein